jgi:hypothetical protein
VYSVEIQLISVDCVLGYNAVYSVEIQQISVDCVLGYNAVYSVDRRLISADFSLEYATPYPTRQTSKSHIRSERDVLGYGTVQSDTWSPTVRRCLLPPSSWQEIETAGSTRS